MRGTALTVAALIGSLLALSPLARQVNVTIDDTFGDAVTGELPVYAGSGRTSDSVQASCKSCPHVVNASQTFMSTWHGLSSAASGASNVSFQFHGTAIYVYCILPVNGTAGTSVTQPSVFLDGQLAATLTVVGARDFSTEAPAYTYNVLVYSAVELSNSRHSFVLAGGSLILFDYAVYTAEGMDETRPEPVGRAIPGIRRYTDVVSMAVATEDGTSLSATRSTSTISAETVVPPGPHETAQVLALLAQPIPPPTADHPVTIGLIIVSIAAAVAYLAALYWFCVRRRKKQEAQMQELTAQPLALPPPTYQPDNTVHPYPMFIPPGLGMLAATSAVQSYGHPVVAGSSGLSPAAAAASMSTVAQPRVRFSKGRSPVPPPPAVPVQRNSILREELEQLREEVEILRARDEPPPVYDDSLLPGPSSPPPAV